MSRQARPRTPDELEHGKKWPAPPEPEPAAPRDGASPDRASLLTVRGALERLSAVIAPPTLVVALAFWFGWTLTNARSAYFGIDVSVLGYSTTDYILRSADAAFVPIAITLLVAAGAVALHGLVRRAASGQPGRNMVRRGAAVGLMLGGALAFLGAWGMLKPLPIATNYLVPPVILGSGPALAAYSAWALRHLGAPRRGDGATGIPAWERGGYAIALMIAVLAVFWASSLYAAALGRGRAEVLAESLASRPAVTVFSQRSLGIDAAGVVVTKITDPAAEYRYRYSGLRLLVHSANKYFLVNDGWSRARGVTIVLDDTAGIRLESTPGAPGG
jgi:hypothetical protein